MNTIVPIYDSLPGYIREYEIQKLIYDRKKVDIKSDTPYKLLMDNTDVIYLYLSRRNVICNLCGKSGLYPSNNTQGNNNYMLKKNNLYLHYKCNIERNNERKRRTNICLNCDKPAFSDFCSKSCYMSFNNE